MANKNLNTFTQISQANWFLYISMIFSELFNRVIGMQKLWGTRIGINRVWQGTAPRVLLFEPETVEVSVDFFN